MKELRQNRYKTVCIEKLQNCQRRKKFGISNPKRLGSKNENEEDVNYLLNQSPSNMSPDSPYSNRDSGRINLVPIKCKNNMKSYMDTLKNQAKVELQKLSLKEKLLQVEYVFKNVRELCKRYGYFTVTYAMLKFHFDQLVKISVWIHPDRRSEKPLHLIKKQTQFQCELTCVLELKEIVKYLFPTIDLGDSKTFGNIIAHVSNSRAELQGNKAKKSIFTRKDSHKTNSSNQNDKGRENFLVVSAKNIPTFGCLKLEDEAVDENNRKAFKNNVKNKETTSTLVQSVRSGQSIRDKIKLQLNREQKQKEGQQIQKAKKARKPSFSEPSKLQSCQDSAQQSPDAAHPSSINSNNINNNITPKPHTLTNPLIPHQQPQQNNNNNNNNRPAQPTTTIQSYMRTSSTKNHLKTSMSGKRLMTMSIEIQSQIDNLFGSQEMRASNHFYNRNSDVKNLKNSILSKVAEEFQDIF